MAELISNDPAYYLRQILSQLQNGVVNSMAYIVLQSDTIQAISTDQANPTVLDNWSVVASNLLSLQGDSIRNDSGRDISFMHGTFGFHPQVDGAGGNRLFNLNSEGSADGVSYTLNNQLRPIYTTNNNETFNTKESYLSNFADGGYVRFIAFADGSMSVAPSSTTMRDETVTGPAMIWILHEA